MKLSESVGWSVLRVNVMRHAEYNLSIYNDKIYSKIMRVCTPESRERDPTRLALALGSPVIYARGHIHMASHMSISLSQASHVKQEAKPRTVNANHWSVQALDVTVHRHRKPLRTQQAVVQRQRPTASVHTPLGAASPRVGQPPPRQRHRPQASSGPTPVRAPLARRAAHQSRGGKRQTRPSSL